MTAAAPRTRLLLGNKFWYPKGGTESYLFSLVEELPGRGYDVIPFAMRHPANRATPYEAYFVDEVDYHTRPSLLTQAQTAIRILYSTQAASRLAGLLDAQPIDLAHLHNIYHQLSPAILPVLTARGIPVLMTLHDLKLACPNYKMRTEGDVCERCKTGGYHHAVLHRCVQGSRVASALCALELFVHRRSRLYERHVARFIVPSRFYLTKLVESGIPAAQLVHIPNFRNVDQFAPSYGGDDYFVFFGRLSEEKGLLTLVDAADGVAGTLVIAGDGPMRPAIEQLIAERGITNVRLLGPLHGEPLFDLVRRARFSVIPSEWYENGPMSGIESFACGTPVVGARIGGIPELVEDGVTGLLFTPRSVPELRQRLQYMLAHAAEAAEMGRAARRKAEREYSTAVHMDALIREYTRVAGHARPQVA